MITIKRAENGFIVIDNQDPEHEVTTLFTDNDIGETTGFLYHILDATYGTGSRYDKERVYIRVGPGDKHEDYVGEDE